MNSIINQKDKKIKQNIVKKKDNFWNSNILFFVLVLVFSMSLSFFLGRISVFENIQKKEIEKIKIINAEKVENSGVVASKKGTVYHLPWCSGAVRISLKNKIFFKNKTDAEKAGYRAAKNCEGL